MTRAVAQAVDARLIPSINLEADSQRGVSDTFASALWALDTLFEAPRGGVDGVNIHPRDTPRAWTCRSPDARLASVYGRAPGKAAGGITSRRMSMQTVVQPAPKPAAPRTTARPSQVPLSRRLMGTPGGAGIAISRDTDPAERDASTRAPAVARAAASPPTGPPPGTTGTPTGGPGRPTGEGDRHPRGTAPGIAPGLLTGFEAALGADLAGVRVHADAAAAGYAAQLHAEAFTVGREVWFAGDRFDPRSARGRELLAHELIHVVDHAGPGRLHRQPGAKATEASGAAPAARRRSGPGGMTDPVVLIEVSTFGSDATLNTTTGARISGHVTGLNLKPGAYELEANYRAKLWKIKGAPGGIQFTLTVDDPDTGAATDDATATTATGGTTVTADPAAAAAPVPQIDPFSLTYVSTLLRVAEAHPPQSDASFDLDAVIFNIDVLVGGPGMMSGKSEDDVIELIESVPASRSAEFMRRLAQPRGDGESLLDAMDDAIHFGNNLRLHEALSMQRLRAAPEKAVAGVANAPVLPWHDVMGFFEDDATFTAEEAGPGKTRVKYLGGSRLRGSTDYGDEIQKLPFDLLIGGMVYDNDQPLIVHDYDAGRFVLVTAGELAGYKHLGVRGFLGHAATVVSFAIPISAAETIAGKVAVVTLERVLPAAFLLVDENRLNLVKWFPKWGPKMIQYSDTLKSLTAAVGFARVAVSGFQIFRQWRDISRARAALEGAAQLDANAERVVAALQKDAEAAFQQAEKARDAESATAAARPGAGTTADPAVTSPQTPRTMTDASEPLATHPATDPHPATGPRPAAGSRPRTEPHATGTPPPRVDPPIPAGKAGRAWEGINEDTRIELRANRELREGLEQNPLVAEAVKLCESSCYPKLTKVQCARLEKALERAEEMNIPVNARELKRAFKATRTAAERDGLINSIEEGINQRVQLDVFADAQKLAGEQATVADAASELDEGYHLTESLRNKPGVAHGGARLRVRTGRLLDPKLGVGPIPGQIAAKLRRIGHFENFGEFRKAFWTLVAEDGQLNQGWSAQNLARMRAGRPPFAGEIAGVKQATGGGSNAVLQLNHIRAIKNAGEVFDLDNIEIVTPLVHGRLGD